MFGFTIGLYKGPGVNGIFETGKKYFIQIRKEKGHYVVMNVLKDKEFIYMDDSKVLESWDIDRNLL